jgi:hypothetical protein
MRYLPFALSVLLFTCVSCDSLITDGENPNSVLQAPPQQLLTKIAAEAFQVEGKNPQYASRMLVSTAVENEIQYYKWRRGSFEPYDRLRNVTKMIEEAKRAQKPAYEALGKFFRAYYFYKLTLTFGDIPYSEALKGETEQISAPAYDRQKVVFEEILDELKNANELLDGEGVIENDIIYGGDARKWKKLINSFRLKVLITLSNKTDDSDLNIENRFATIYGQEPVFESIADNGQLSFFDQIGSRYGEYNDSDYGSSMYMDSTFVHRLEKREDPRLAIYADQTKNAKEDGRPVDDFSSYGGGRPIGQYSYNDNKAAAGLISKVDPRYYTDPTNEPHVLLGYSELQFILAEASVRGWIESDAQTHYEKGIQASFEFYSSYAEDYAEYVDGQAAENYMQNDLVAFEEATTDQQKIERILMQKYLRSFLQGGWTPYFEHLRTGYPSFMEPETGPPPTRWMYPQSEYRNNNDHASEAVSRQFSSDDIRAVSWWLK